MLSLPRSASRFSRGFTLVELMVGVVIGLLATLAVTQVLVSYEGQKRSIVSGSDAQINGSLAMHALQRSIASAGYGFANNLTTLGCSVQARFNGATPTGFISALEPIRITAGANSDTLRVFASGKTSFSLPVRIVSPGYDPAIVARSTQFPVAAVQTLKGPAVDGGGNPLSPGDLLMAVIDSTQPCQVFQATSDGDPTSLVIARATDNAKWNPTGFPTTAYGNGNFLINLGIPIDRTYSVTSSNTLQIDELRIAADGTPSRQTQDLFPNIVSLRAMYGKDTDADGVVDAWNKTAPTTNAEWRQVLAVRIAVVARSDQYEKDAVTTAAVLWDVGNAVTTQGATTCGASKCVSIDLSFLGTQWQNYRYKVFDTVVPLRNMLWTS